MCLDHCSNATRLRYGITESANGSNETASNGVGVQNGFERWGTTACSNWSSRMSRREESATHVCDVFYYIYSLFGVRTCRVAVHLLA